MHRNAGFTVVELMIAIAIMAVGAVLAAPMLTGLLESSRITSTTNNIVEALATARGEAIRRGQPVSVMPVDTDWTKGWEVQVSADGTVISRFDSIPSSVSISASETVASVEFQPNGMRTSTVDDPATAVTLDICGDGPNGRQILLSVSGSTKINSAYAGCP